MLYSSRRVSITSSDVEFTKSFECLVLAPQEGVSSLTQHQQVHRPAKRGPLLWLRAILIATLFTSGAVVATAGPAQAATGATTLCTGEEYSTCIAANYTAHGYESHNSTSYWNAYSGHNCTNYVGYMLTQNGDAGHGVAMGVAKDWDNTISNHPSWNYTMNGIPAVGSIAQWEADTGPATSSGHVAYVEAITILPGNITKITISEDNWPNEMGSHPFSWKTITSDGTHWPTRFLHIKDEAVTPPPASWNGVGSSAVFKGSDSLTTSQELHANEYIMSSNGQTVLMMQTDGNLVAYRGGGAIWHSNTGGHPGAYLVVQIDGNVVVYSSSNIPLWWTYTTNVTTFTVQTDGNIAGYPATGTAVWQTGTGGQNALTNLSTDHLSASGQIHPNQFIRSADGRYFLMAQTDGNIVLYGPGYHVLWTTGTGGHPGGAYITVQTDGNVVVYSATSAPLWWTGTNNTATLWLQNDGNLVGRSSANTATWWTGTGGQI